MINKTTFNLRNITSFCKELFLIRIELNGKHFSINTTVAPDIPNEIFSDPDRLNQVLVNLHSNSFKFTNSGSIIFRSKKA